MISGWDWVIIGTGLLALVGVLISGIRGTGQEVTLYLDATGLEECLEGLVRSLVVLERYYPFALRLVLLGEGLELSPIGNRLVRMYPGISLGVSNLGKKS